MFCENCGTTLRDGALFCTNCGAKVQPLVQTEIPKAPQPPVIPQPPQAAQSPRADKAPAASASSFAQAARPAQSADPFRAAESAQSGTIRADAPKKNLLPWILGVAGVAVLVLLVVLLWPKHSSAAATEPLTLDIPDSPNSAGTGADHGASAGQSSDGSDGERADEGNYLYIKDTLTYRTYDDESTDFMDKNGRAHHLSDGWPGWSIHAADDSRMVVSYDDGVYLYDGSDSGQWIAPEDSGFLISYDGSAVALTVPEGDSRSLRLIRGDEQIQIDAGEEYYQMTLSPHGEALCYGYEVDGEWIWYLWKDGEQTYLDIDTSYVMALDDEASLIYYLGWKNHGFYVRTPEGDRMLGASDDNGLQSKNFNCDNTEVLFEDDGSTYLSVRGGEPQLLTTTSCWPLVPNGTQIFQLSPDAFVHQRGIRTFAGAFFSQYRTGWSGSAEAAFAAPTAPRAPTRLTNACSATGSPSSSSPTTAAGSSSSMHIWICTSFAAAASRSSSAPPRAKPTGIRPQTASRAARSSSMPPMAMPGAPTAASRWKSRALPAQ